MTPQATTYLKVRVAVKDLDRRGLVGVKDIPMVDRAVGNQAQAGFADPLPESDVLVHSGGLELLFLLQVEDLEGAGLRSKGNDLARPVHDGTVGLDGTSDDIVVVLEVDNEDLGGRGFVLLLSNADVMIRL
jgi:hypothetical protein